MSLTSMINGKDEKDIQFQEIIKQAVPTKDMFKTISGKKPFTKEYKLLTPDILETTYQYTIVGNAFDYLMRFEIAKVVDCNKKEVYENVAAERGLNILKRFVDKKIYEILSDKYNESIRIVNQYIFSKENDEKQLILSSCFLGRLDIITRTGMPPQDIEASLISDEPKNIIADLNSLLSIFRNDFIFSGLIKSDSDVVFNPHFGIIAMFVGGADADIYIDGVLYDIKTTKNNGFKWQNSAQITVYYLLNELAKSIEVSDKIANLIHRDIYRIALYKPRFGEIEYIDIKDLDDYNLNQAINGLKKMSKLTYMD